MLSYFALLLLAWPAVRVCQAECGETTLTKPFDLIYYQTRFSENCEWQFAPRPDGPHDVLILNVFYVRSDNYGEDQITLPNGESITSNIEWNQEGLCRSYLIANNHDRNCDNEFIGQYCETLLTNLTSNLLQLPTVTTSHRLLSPFLSPFTSPKFHFSFTYLFVDCPKKLTIEPYTTVSTATTTRVSAKSVFWKNAATSVKGTSTSFETKQRLTNSTSIRNGEDTTKNANAPLANSHQQDQHNMLMLIVIILLVAVLVISWIVIGILAIKLHGGKAKKSRDGHRDSGDSEPAESNPQDSQQARDGQIGVNGSSISEETTIYLQPLQPVYSIAEEHLKREAFDNFTYQSRQEICASTLTNEEIKDQRDLYSLANIDSTGRVVNNILYETLSDETGQ